MAAGICELSGCIREWRNKGFDNFAGSRYNRDVMVLLQFDRGTRQAVLRPEKNENHNAESERGRTEWRPDKREELDRKAV